MNETRAMEILMEMGWDEIGAEEIILQLKEDEMFDGMTEDELRQISEDYMDR